MRNDVITFESFLSGRIALMYRTTFLFVVKLTTDILFLVYMNTNEFIISYAFGGTCVFLVSANRRNEYHGIRNWQIFFSSNQKGLMLLICYVFKAKSRMKYSDQQTNNPKHFIEDFCSTSINSPLNCNRKLWWLLCLCTFRPKLASIVNAVHFTCQFTPNTIWIRMAANHQRNRRKNCRWR